MTDRIELPGETTAGTPDQLGPRLLDDGRLLLLYRQPFNWKLTITNPGSYRVVAPGEFALTTYDDAY